jgi:hypothetical protein
VNAVELVNSPVGCTPAAGRNAPPPRPETKARKAWNTADSLLRFRVA